jgi:hypothetical protein
MRSIVFVGDTGPEHGDTGTLGRKAEKICATGNAVTPSLDERSVAGKRLTTFAANAIMIPQQRMWVVSFAQREAPCRV